MKNYSYDDLDFKVTYGKWYKVINEKPTLFCHKVEKFLLKKKTSDYIEDDLGSTYSAIESDSFNKDTSLSKPFDMPMSIEDLKI